MKAHAIPLVAALVIATDATAQVPIIDYSFLALPPSVEVNSIVVQPDGRILMGGAFTNYAGSGKNNLVRLNSDGTVDPGWNPGGTGPGNAVEDIVLMPDGRIIIGGNFVEYNSEQVQFVARLMPSGLLDGSFNIPPNSINNEVLAVELHADEKVLAAGDFFMCYGHSMPHIARFNSDGSLDMSFDIGSGFDSRVHDLLVLPDLRVLVAGDFSTFNGNPCGRVALLSPDGPYDPSMDNDPGLTGTVCTAHALLRQPDGKLLVSGAFSTHNGSPANGIVRLDIDGTRDPGFTSPFYPFAQVDAMALQADGRILVGGEYTGTMYDPNVPGPERLTRLHADGSRDDSFALGDGILPDPGATAFVRSIAVQADGKILVGGKFGALHTETQYKQIIRLREAAISNGITEQSTTSDLHAWMDPASGDVIMSASCDVTGSATLLIHAANGQLVYRSTVATTPGTLMRVHPCLVLGIHSLTLEQNGHQVTMKLLVP